MEATTKNATEQADGAAAGSGDIGETRHKNAMWASRDPYEVAEYIERLKRENVELRAAVKSQPALLEMRTFDGHDSYLSGLVVSARILEKRGDKCHVGFKRDSEGEIVGVVLSVEDR